MTRTETLTIDGMTCGHCVRAVESALGALDGVAVESVRTGEARVRYDDEAVARGALVRAVEAEGYAVRT